MRTEVFSYSYDHSQGKALLGLADGRAVSIDTDDEKAMDDLLTHSSYEEPELAPQEPPTEEGITLEDLHAFRNSAMEQWFEINAEQAARAAHEINRAYCQAIGDDSQVPWDDAPQWQRDSAINGVKLHLKNPGTTPEQSHENWMAEKAAAGWVYGTVKDPDAKTHPCMVPFDQLPQEQRVKDHLFAAVVRQFA